MNLQKIGAIEVDVEVKTIIEALEKHRAQHILDYEETMSHFNARFLAARDKAIKDLKKAEVGNFDGLRANFGLIVPQNKTKMYDDFIASFRSVATTQQVLKLDLNELDTIINNKWDWIEVANASFSSYNAKFAG